MVRKPHLASISNLPQGTYTTWNVIMKSFVVSAQPSVPLDKLPVVVHWAISFTLTIHE
jgi:hypothetical protein